MKFKGYFITSEKKNKFEAIVNRIKEMGKDMYEYYHCYPQYIITFKHNYNDFQKNQKVIYFNCENQDMDNLHFLGFGFEGLVDVEDKIKEIESFGKYGCIIIKVDEDFDVHNVDQFIIDKFEF